MYVIIIFVVKVLLILVLFVKNKWNGNLFFLNLDFIK